MLRGRTTQRWSGWNKQLASETSLRVGSEVPQAQVGLRVEQIGQRELRTSESCRAPSLASPPHCTEVGNSRLSGCYRPG